ncbi:MAG: hypothetical protein WKF37_16460 [Bryobacteraceae bacterium]
MLTRTLFLVPLLLSYIYAAEELEIATITAFTEGPAVDREGNVYFTKQSANAL